MRRLARALVVLYPEPWRERYGDEMRALIEDDPPRLRGLGSIVLGAANAHLRPLAVWRTTTPATSRMRASISGMFCCWIALSVAGAGFQKETEDPPYAIAGHQHTVLSAARDLVLAGALLGAAVIALVGLPLCWRAVRQAYLERDVRLTLALALAPAAIGSFALLTGALVRLARGNPEHTHTTTTLAIVLAVVRRRPALRNGVRDRAAACAAPTRRARALAHARFARGRAAGAGNGARDGRADPLHGLARAARARIVRQRRRSAVAEHRQRARGRRRARGAQHRARDPRRRARSPCSRRAGGRSGYARRLATARATGRPSGHGPRPCPPAYGGTPTPQRACLPSLTPPQRWPARRRSRRRRSSSGRCP